MIDQKDQKSPDKKKRLLRLPGIYFQKRHANKNHHKTKFYYTKHHPKPHPFQPPPPLSPPQLPGPPDLAPRLSRPRQRHRRQHRRADEPRWRASLPKKKSVGVPWPRPLEGTVGTAMEKSGIFFRKILPQKESAFCFKKKFTKTKTHCLRGPMRLHIHCKSKTIKIVVPSTC